MSKRLILLCSLAILVGLALPVYAEVQNVKVGGDITVYGIARDNYSVTGSGGGRSLTVGTDTESRDSYLTTTRLRIDADLTDNVSTTIRLINERDWGETETDATTDIDVDLAYVTLKEMLYSPLTLRLGKQDLRLGSGLVIGDGVRTADPAGILESDLSARKAFDAILAVLDYDPLTLNLAIAKLAEATQASTDDVDAYIVDAVYKFPDNKTIADLYYVLGYYSSPTGAVSGPSGVSSKSTDVNVIGARLTGQPVENLSGELELAYQFGDYDKTATTTRDLDAWALTAGANYAFQAQNSPALGLKYGYRSGQKAGVTTGDYEAWLPLYEDQVNGVIYDPNTNISFINVSGSLKPVEDILLSANYYNYRYAKKLAASTTSKGKKDAGDELDLSLTYNYTEDVSLGLLGAIFWPGDDYVNDKTATQVIGSMKVTF